MTKLLIVDGYNLIHATDRYKKWRDSDLELARAKLIEDLATLQTVRDYKITLVFDAAATDARSRSCTNILGVEVWFTRAGETADQLIERFAAQKDFEGDMVVATSDYMQQRVVFRPGVLRKSARELAVELQSTEEELQEFPQKSKRFALEERLDTAILHALERMTGKRK